MEELLYQLYYCISWFYHWKRPLKLPMPSSWPWVKQHKRRKHGNWKAVQHETLVKPSGWSLAWSCLLDLAYLVAYWLNLDISWLPVTGSLDYLFAYLILISNLLIGCYRYALVPNGLFATGSSPHPAEPEVELESRQATNLRQVQSRLIGQVGIPTCHYYMSIHVQQMGEFHEFNEFQIGELNVSTS